MPALFFLLLNLSLSCHFLRKKINQLGFLRMKIQCNVCEVAEAKLLCCADEAALCWACDQKIHAANKLASKHQRVLLSSSQIPKCDICQEAVGYFFCLEDRALLCRNCDVSIHTSNNLVSTHRRFLLTGVKLGPEADELGSSSLMGKSMPTEKIAEPDRSLFRNSSSVSTESQYSKQLSMQLDGIGLAGGSGTGSIPQWEFDQFLGLIDGSPYYMENASSKADAGKLGDSDSSAILRTCEEELDGDDYLGQVPDISFTVPEIPSPPTASGLCWSKAYQNPCDSTLFVPDISSSPMQNLYGYQPQGRSLKRQRQF